MSSISFRKILAIGAKYFSNFPFGSLFFSSFRITIIPTHLVWCLLWIIIFCILFVCLFFSLGFTLNICYWPVFQFIIPLFCYVGHAVKPICSFLNFSYYTFCYRIPLDYFYRVQYTDEMFHHLTYFFSFWNCSSY